MTPSICLVSSWLRVNASARSSRSKILLWQLERKPIGSFTPRSSTQSAGKAPTEGKILLFASTLKGYVNNLSIRANHFLESPTTLALLAILRAESSLTLGHRIRIYRAPKPTAWSLFFCLSFPQANPKGQSVSPLVWSVLDESKCFKQTSLGQKFPFCNWNKNPSCY